MNVSFILWPILFYLKIGKMMKIHKERTYCLLCIFVWWNLSIFSYMNRCFLDSVSVDSDEQVDNRLSKDTVYIWNLFFTCLSISFSISFCLFQHFCTGNKRLSFVPSSRHCLPLFLFIYGIPIIVGQVSHKATKRFSLSASNKMLSITLLNRRGYHKMNWFWKTPDYPKNADL